MESEELSSTPRKKTYRVVSHRCKGFGEPSNSSAALRAALASSVDEIELDFRMTKDGGLVAAHLPWFRSSAGIIRLISFESLSEALYNGLMTLSEALDLFAERGEGKLLRLELKGTGFEQQLLNAVVDRNLLDRVTLVSWRASTAKTLRTLNPNVRIGYSFLLGTQSSGWLPLCSPNKIPSLLLKTPTLINSVVIVPSLLYPNVMFIRALQSLKVEVCLVTTYGSWTKARIQELEVDAVFTSQPDQFS